MERNQVLLGDAYELIKQVPTGSVDLIVTDPPYLIESTQTGSDNRVSRSFQKVNDELAAGQLTQGVRPEILDEFIRVCKKPNIYIFCNHKQIPMYLDILYKKHKCKFDILIWHKPNSVPTYNNKYLTDKEYCLYFRKGGRCMPENYNDARTVWEYQSPHHEKASFAHPTCKPLEIIKTLVRNSSLQGELILDPFAGSGTTPVAAKLLGRDYIAFEIEEQWHKVIVERLEGKDATGQKRLFLQ